MQKMRQIVAENNIYKWAADIIHDCKIWIRVIVIGVLFISRPDLLKNSGLPAYFASQRLRWNTYSDCWKAGTGYPPGGYQECYKK